eukprot:SAG31_NODE_4696_length_3026_cov_3.073454_3_plen_42_part_01
MSFDPRGGGGGGGGGVFDLGVFPLPEVYIEALYHKLKKHTSL